MHVDNMECQNNAQVECAFGELEQNSESLWFV